MTGPRAETKVPRCRGFLTSGLQSHGETENRVPGPTGHRVPGRLVVKGMLILRHSATKTRSLGVGHVDAEGPRATRFRAGSVSLAGADIVECSPQSRATERPSNTAPAGDATRGWSSLAHAKPQGFPTRHFTNRYAFVLSGLSPEK